MNLPSDLDSAGGAGRRGDVQGAAGVETMHVFRAQERSISPFEFRLLSGDDPEEMWGGAESPSKWQARGFSDDQPEGAGVRGSARGAQSGDSGQDRAARESAAHGAIEAARLEGLREGEREGRRAIRAELELEMHSAVAQERERVRTTVEQFCGVRERYFTEVEQEIVKLALAIASRVLHREAQIDSLLLTGVVRVALGKMADRSGVVLRVPSAEVEAWEQVFQASDEPERPRVSEDTRLERGNCVLETKMGTVELGVQVQLEEIEKGFFDLLNHRPAQ